ncbi:two-component sensor histidine kinase [Nocardioides sp. JQ2195]|uniref:sensor histidine kinase n=1 Tax=Nocardioides sp. JQ2195 TaxID=2592334 RepID=UPI00143E92AF|nr:ATP-binding protein [Nocardioides sp. JQ2195]QIX25652.1 two-component sensor histidine kinase [Nocardioides sp. JQ2195]
MTTPQTILFALLIGLFVAGVVLAFVLSERQQQRIPDSAEPPVPSGVAAVLSVLRSSAVVLNEADEVLKASAPAYALGLVQGNQIKDAALVDVVHQVRRDGQIRETELVMARTASSPARHVTARIAPLGTRQILVLVDDRTRERRVEAIRRDFVANVSHELKTPIGAVRILAEAVQDASDDPEAVERFAGRMIVESERLARLVQQIIELSRLQGDDPLDEPMPVEVDAIISTAVDTVAIDAQSRGLSVIASGDKGLQVVGNAEQIAVAVGNLVANAVNYSPDRSAVLVSARANEDSVDIAVTDQGIGIPQDEIDRIFERFYRVDPARHRSTGGTGLGLSIVKHVAATHGGDIRVWSAEGQGSTFTLSLPRKKQEALP